MGDTHGGWSGCASGLSSLEETKSTSQCPHGCHRGGQGEGPSLNGQRPPATKGWFWVFVDAGANVARSCLTLLQAGSGPGEASELPSL